MDSLGIVLVTISIIGLCSALPISLPTESIATGWLMGSAFMLGAALITVGGCLCCKRKKGFKEFNNEPGSATHTVSAESPFPIFRPLTQPATQPIQNSNDNQSEATPLNHPESPILPHNNIISTNQGLINQFSTEEPIAVDNLEPNISPERSNNFVTPPRQHISPINNLASIRNNMQIISNAIINIVTHDQIEIDNNNGPISELDIQNIANNNAEGYIRNQNEIYENQNLEIRNENQNLVASAPVLENLVHTENYQTRNIYEPSTSSGVSTTPICQNLSENKNFGDGDSVQKSNLHTDSLENENFVRNISLFDIPQSRNLVEDSIDVKNLDEKDINTDGAGFLSPKFEDKFEDKSNVDDVNEALRVLESVLSGESDCDSASCSSLAEIQLDFGNDEPKTSDLKDLDPILDIQKTQQSEEKCVVNLDKIENREEVHNESVNLELENVSKSDVQKTQDLEQNCVVNLNESKNNEDFVKSQNLSLENFLPKSDVQKTQDLEKNYVVNFDETENIKEVHIKSKNSVIENVDTVLDIQKTLDENEDKRGFIKSKNVDLENIVPTLDVQRAQDQDQSCVVNLDESKNSKEIFIKSENLDLENIVPILDVQKTQNEDKSSVVNLDEYKNSKEAFVRSENLDDVGQNLFLSVGRSADGPMSESCIVNLDESEIQKHNNTNFDFVEDLVKEKVDENITEAIKALDSNIEIKNNSIPNLELDNLDETTRNKNVGDFQKDNPNMCSEILVSKIAACEPDVIEMKNDLSCDKTEQKVDGFENEYVETKSLEKSPKLSENQQILSETCNKENVDNNTVVQKEANTENVEGNFLDDTATSDITKLQKSGFDQNIKSIDSPKDTKMSNPEKTIKIDTRAIEVLESLNIQTSIPTESIDKTENIISPIQSEHQNSAKDPILKVLDTPEKTIKIDTKAIEVLESLNIKTSTPTKTIKTTENIIAPEVSIRKELLQKSLPFTETPKKPNYDFLKSGQINLESWDKFLGDSFERSNEEDDFEFDNLEEINHEAKIVNSTYTKENPNIGDIADITGDEFFYIPQAESSQSLEDFERDLQNKENIRNFGNESTFSPKDFEDECWGYQSTGKDDEENLAAIRRALIISLPDAQGPKTKEICSNFENGTKSAQNTPDNVQAQKRNILGVLEDGMAGSSFQFPEYFINEGNSEERNEIYIRYNAAGPLTPIQEDWLGEGNEEDNSQLENSNLGSDDLKMSDSSESAGRTFIIIGNQGDSTSYSDRSAITSDKPRQVLGSWCSNDTLFNVEDTLDIEKISSPAENNEENLVQNFDSDFEDNTLKEDLPVNQNVENIEAITSEVVESEILDKILMENCLPLVQIENFGHEENATVMNVVENQVEENLVEENWASKNLVDENLVIEDFVDEILVIEDVVDENVANKNLGDGDMVKENLVDENVLLDVNLDISTQRKCPSLENSINTDTDLVETLREIEIPQILEKIDEPINLEIKNLVKTASENETEMKIQNSISDQRLVTEIQSDINTQNKCDGRIKNENLDTEYCISEPFPKTESLQINSKFENLSEIKNSVLSENSTNIPVEINLCKNENARNLVSGNEEDGILVKDSKNDISKIGIILDTKNFIQDPSDKENGCALNNGNIKKINYDFLSNEKKYAETKFLGNSNTENKPFLEKTSSDISNKKYLVKKSDTKINFFPNEEKENFEGEQVKIFDNFRHLENGICNGSTNTNDDDSSSEHENEDTISSNTDDYDTLTSSSQSGQEYELQGDIIEEDEKLCALEENSNSNKNTYNLDGENDPWISTIKFSDNDMMTTSFSSESPMLSPQSADCVQTKFAENQQDSNFENLDDDTGWESEDTSGEFEWKSGDQENLENPKTKNDQILEEANTTIMEETINEMEEIGENENIVKNDVIEEGATSASKENLANDEDDENDEYDDSSDESEEIEFIPSTWNSLAAPSRSSLKSPENNTANKKGRSVVFKKEKYLSVYEYPREQEHCTYIEPTYDNSLVIAPNGPVLCFDRFFVTSTTLPFNEYEFYPTNSDTSKDFNTNEQFNWLNEQENPFDSEDLLNSGTDFDLHGTLDTEYKIGDDQFSLDPMPESDRLYEFTDQNLDEFDQDAGTPWSSGNEEVTSFMSPDTPDSNNSQINSKFKIDNPKLSDFATPDSGIEITPNPDSCNIKFSEISTIDCSEFAKKETQNLMDFGVKIKENKEFNNIDNLGMLCHTKRSLKLPLNIQDIKNEENLDSMLDNKDTPISTNNFEENDKLVDKDQEMNEQDSVTSVDEFENTLNVLKQVLDSTKNNEKMQSDLLLSDVGSANSGDEDSGIDSATTLIDINNRS